MSVEPPHAGEQVPPGDQAPGKHPLAGIITAAAAGRFPDPDGGWERVPPWRPGLEAIISFTGHAVAAVAPGNAASVRALLSAGFVPLGSVQLFRRSG